MNAERQFVTTVPIEISIVGATLLSEEECVKNQKLIPPLAWWWTRSPDPYDKEAAGCVLHDGRVDSAPVNDELVHIRPALIYNQESSDVAPGDKVILNGATYTVLHDGYLLRDEEIGRDSFRNDYKDSSANDYDKSDVKKVVDKWYRKEFEYGTR